MSGRVLECVEECGGGNSRVWRGEVDCGRGEVRQFVVKTRRSVGEVMQGSSDAVSYEK